uniref:Saposin B-type domain-containing protein n=1 Tax=Steinernema glaseri TaxID=37863 RepID=A0A1I8AVV3_9BILA
MCPPSMRLAYCLLVAASLISVVEAGLLCDICVRTISGIIEEVYHSAGTIDDVLGYVCDKMFHDSITRTACKAIVDGFVETIKQAIERKESPEAVCHFIGSCGNTTELLLAERSLE